MAITVCGDGGTGMFSGFRMNEWMDEWMDEIGLEQGVNLGIGKSSISLRLVRSKWTHE